MKPHVVAFGMAMIGLALSAPQAPAAFDPTGSWKVSTVSDEGQPMSVSVTIKGKPGAYAGQAVTGERTLPLTDLATTPTGMIAVFALPQGAIVVQLGANSAGKFTGTWGAMDQTFSMTAERAK
jgi:hypothetical protein